MTTQSTVHEAPGATEPPAMGLLAVAAPALANRIHARLEIVEDLLRTQLTHPEDAVLTERALHLIAAGGKRLRPLLVLLAAEFGHAHARDDDAVHRAAAVVELTHVATLYHDDVMDESPLRHGVSTGHTLWGNRAAILTGDYLLAKAAVLTASLGTGLGADAQRRYAATLTRLVSGQLHESMDSQPGQDPVAHYDRVIADKSASLFSLALQLGAATTSATAAVTDDLGAYGEELGLAFQISDDILDVVAPAAVTGKPAGADLREGIRSLPVLYGLEGDEPDAARLRAIVDAGPTRDPQALAEALDILRRSPGTVRAYLRMRQHAHRARLALTHLPNTPARAALFQLTDLATERVARHYHLNPAGADAGRSR